MIEEPGVTEKYFFQDRLEIVRVLSLGNGEAAPHGCAFLAAYFDIQFSVALALDHIAERFIEDHIHFAGRVGGDVHVEQEIGFFLP